MNKIKPRYVLIALACWWLFFLNISYFFKTDFSAPSTETYLLFLVFIGSFFWGGLLGLSWRVSGLKIDNQLLVHQAKVRIFIFPVIFFFVILFFLLYKSGAFYLGPAEYFFIRRGAGADGSNFEDTVFDSAITFLGIPFFIYIQISGGIKFLKIASSIFLLGFAYLYQVNYPIIYMFWVFFIKSIVLDKIGRREIVLIFSIFILIFFAAANRYGSFDIRNIFNYYFLNYHIAGFSLFDRMLLDGESPIHNHTFGIWSLGSLVHLLSIGAGKVGISWPISSYAAYSEYISTAVDIGRVEFRGVNAFNTMLATFYKDFHLFGAIGPPFIYGFFTMMAYKKSYFSIVYRNLFVGLSLSWVIGFMISPIERPVFWFVILLVLIFDRKKRNGKNHLFSKNLIL